MVDFLDMLYDLEGTGFYEVVLPFLLVFSIIFAVLEKSDILQDKRINAVVALVAGFLMVRNDVLVEFMNDILARFSVVLVVILAFLIIFGIFGAKTENWGKGIFAFFIIISLIVGMFILSERLGYHNITGNTDVWDFLDEYSQTVWIVIFILVIFGIIFWGGDTKDKGDNFLGRAGSQLGHPGGRGGGG